MKLRIKYTRNFVFTLLFSLSFIVCSIAQETVVVQTLTYDSTGRDYDMIARQHNMLKQMGYDCYMVFVNTTLEVALARNARRERSIPEYITKSSWNGVQDNIGKFQRLFGLSKFLVVDNNKSDLELVTLTMNRVGKVVRGFLRQPVQNYIAKQWMKKELEARKRI